MTAFADPSPALRLAKLRRLALVVRALILIGALVLVGSTIYVWAVPGKAFEEIKDITCLNLDRVSASARIVGGLWTIVPLSITLTGLHRLWALFGEYAAARVFSRRALTCLRDVARAILAMAFVSPIYTAVLCVIATWANPPGQRQLSLNFSSDDYTLLLLGAVLLAISSVMAEAASVAEDNAGFV